MIENARPLTANASLSPAQTMRKVGIFGERDANSNIKRQIKKMNANVHNAITSERQAVSANPAILGESAQRLSELADAIVAAARSNPAYKPVFYEFVRSLVGERFNIVGKASPEELWQHAQHCVEPKMIESSLRRSSNVANVAETNPNSSPKDVSSSI